jgi:hypothetical protein
VVQRLYIFDAFLLIGDGNLNGGFKVKTYKQETIKIMCGAGNFLKGKKREPGFGQTNRYLFMTAV